MKVTRLQLGVYANQQPFYLYLFHLVVSSPVSSPPGQDLPSKNTLHPFYRLKDIEAIFFEQQETGYILKSRKIPQVYFDTPGYCFHERSGDAYLAARAIRETGTRLGNHLLAEFCKYGRTEIISGMADKLLESVNVTRTSGALDTEFEFFTLDSTYTPTMSPTSNNTPHIRSPNNPNSTTNGHLSPPPTNGRKRMSLEAVLDNDDNTNNRRYASSVTSPVERTISPVGSDRGTPTIKQEPSPSYSGSENSNPSSPNQSPRSPHSPSSPLASSEAIDEENRMRKRRRVTVQPTIGSNNIKVTNNPEVMEQVRNTLKLKQQQKAIIEARQQQAQQQMLQQQQNFIDRRHSTQGTWESNRTSNTLSKRNSASNRSNRNSRNLSVFAPPYNDISSLSSSASPGVSKVRGQNSAGLTNNRQIPLTAPIPINSSAPNKQGVSGFPLSANSAFRPTSHSQSLNTHSASTSASINGLISPHNVEDVRSNSVSSSPLPLHSPGPRLPRTSKSVTNPASRINGEQPSKESFIHLFDSFYDTVADTRSLKTTLEDQIRKTTTLLQTLQASGSMIESLVRGHFREMQREVVKDLMTLEKRLSKVEERMRNNATAPGMSPSPPLDPDRRLSDISTASSDMGYSNNKNASAFAQKAANNSSSQYSSVNQLTHSSPPLSSVSSHSNVEESQPKDYEYILKALKARLESLERRMSVP